MNNLSATKEPIMVSVSELPVSCPPATQWDAHPRVYIKLSSNSPQQSCPYCGAVYVLRQSEGA